MDAGDEDHDEEAEQEGAEACGHGHGHGECSHGPEGDEDDDGPASRWEPGSLLEVSGGAAELQALLDETAQPAVVSRAAARADRSVARSPGLRRVRVWGHAVRVRLSCCVRLVGCSLQAVLWHAPWAVASREAEAALAGLAERQQDVVFAVVDVEASQVTAGQGLGGFQATVVCKLLCEGWHVTQHMTQMRGPACQGHPLTTRALQHAQANQALSQSGVKLVAPQASKRADARPTLRDGSKWPCLTLHAPPYLQPQATFAGPSALASLRCVRRAGDVGSWQRGPGSQQRVLCIRRTHLVTCSRSQVGHPAASI